MITFFLLIVSLSRPAGVEKMNLAILQALVSKPICVNVAPRVSAYKGMIGPTMPSPSIATKIDTSKASSERSIAVGDTLAVIYPFINQQGARSSCSSARLLSYKVKTESVPLAI